MNNFKSFFTNEKPVIKARHWWEHTMMGCIIPLQVSYDWIRAVTPPKYPNVYVTPKGVIYFRWKEGYFGFEVAVSEGGTVITTTRWWLEDHKAPYSWANGVLPRSSAKIVEVPGHGHFVDFKETNWGALKGSQNS